MLDGVLIIDKPDGLTSHDVVARVRRILSERRVGHTGTLDPFATGVLVVLVGRATRLAQFLSNAEKEYEAEIRFGYATDTGDRTGKRLEISPAQNVIEGSVHTWSEREIEAALDGLRGEIEQVPPMYSAKKVQGRKLYELARRGVEIERVAVRVTIRELEVVPRSSGAALLQENEDGTSDLRVRVICSAGTYIRTLAESIGERLGVAAHLASLRRTRAGDFPVEDALSLDELKERREAGEAETIILSSDAALSRMPFVHLRTDEASRTLHGIALGLSAGTGTEWRDNEPVRMRDMDGRLIAVGFYDAASRSLRPRVVLSPEK
ncbi:MAG: tRNA pseudouridine55 synthase [Acidobacteriota bacterium]|jgi:tRNA pseudouridine55 synthase|nr:tRNA pseudouridine55 synthase [Acidobacteriota bacterium]